MTRDTGPMIGCTARTLKMAAGGLAVALGLAACDTGREMPARGLDRQRGREARAPGSAAAAESVLAPALREGAVLRRFASPAKPGIYRPRRPAGAGAPLVLDIEVEMKMHAGFPLYRMTLMPQNFGAGALAGWPERIALAGSAGGDAGMLVARMPTRDARFGPHVASAYAGDRSPAGLSTQWTYCGGCFGASAPEGSLAAARAFAEGMRPFPHKNATFFAGIPRRVPGVATAADLEDLRRFAIATGAEAHAAAEDAASIFRGGARMARRSAPGGAAPEAASGVSSGVAGDAAGAGAIRREALAPDDEAGDRAVSGTERKTRSAPRPDMAMEPGDAAQPAESTGTVAPVRETVYVARLLPDGADMAIGAGGACIGELGCETGKIVPLIATRGWCAADGGVTETESGYAIVVQRYRPATASEEQKLIDGGTPTPVQIVAESDAKALADALEVMRQEVTDSQGETIYYRTYEAFHAINESRGCTDAWRDSAQHKVAENA